MLEEELNTGETPLISVIIPVQGGSPHLPACLESLKRASFSEFECIVVSDGFDAISDHTALSYGALSLCSPRQGGPAQARNLGAQKASGKVLLFLDSDVCVQPNVLSRVAQAFQTDPSLDALIGSYDDTPQARNFVSVYRNLHHHYVHQLSRPVACTFWTGCGAVRNAVFRSYGGFDERYERPATEDIEFGYRLVAGGRKILLDKGLLVTHLKRWNLLSMVKSDILDRAIPWTELIFQFRRFPNDLNLRTSQRASVVLVFLALAMAVAWKAGGAPGAPFISLVVLLIGLSLNIPFYRYLATREGVRFALAAIPLHLIYFFCSGLGFSAGLLRVMVDSLPLRRSLQSERARQ
jgi:hypothetical protein